MPVFYKLHLVSAHEYLELRFGQSVRWTTSVVYCVQMIIYIALALYAPALAFSQVSGLPIWISVLSTGLVTTFYTALGGIRAVVWTDAVQLIILTTGLLLVVSIGVVRVGGMVQLWRVAYKGLRVQSFDSSVREHYFSYTNLQCLSMHFSTDPNPFKRHTIWTLMIGGAGMILSIYATNQTQVQRYLACRDLRTARLSILLNIPLNALFLIVQLLSGLVSYVYFVGCDPISSGSVSKSDQILPYIVMVLFEGIPVIRGLFLSVIFAAAISTVSSGINSLATAILEDIVKPFLLFVRKRAISEHATALLAVLFSIIVGLCTVGMSFVFMVMGPRVLQFAFSLFGAMGGPILAVFTLGMVIPCVNWQGALGGLIGSLTVGLGLTVGGILHPNPGIVLPLSTENCTTDFNSSLVINMKSVDQSWNIFSLSYLYYTLVCVCAAILVAIPISAIFGESSA
ncbi:solute carrier family 5 (sodium-coupled monocarboxylate transporter), member 8/12 [Paragonimus westermani]|uniref:Solute carrier family 5 (Sodium-coupled monocarboxylate transporter), member 8/12 n=1 Tax=Paragonimus westermani TaxID=34504 RepID=A0A5J4NYZ3_9TREM|nr:solute carrier family 5 (sodium-coupled monocarboxylate transporter), member 8/12 [Paragonimus westermani]